MKNEPKVLKSINLYEPKYHSLLKRTIAGIEMDSILDIAKDYSKDSSSTPKPPKEVLVGIEEVAKIVSYRMFCELERLFPEYMGKVVVIKHNSKNGSLFLEFLDEDVEKSDKTQLIDRNLDKCKDLSDALDNGDMTEEEVAQKVSEMIQGDNRTGIA